MKRIPMMLLIDRSLLRELTAIADEHHTTVADMLRQGLSVLKAFRAYRQNVPDGRIGFATDPRALDVKIVGILSDASAE